MSSGYVPGDRSTARRKSSNALDNFADFCSRVDIFTPSYSQFIIQCNTGRTSSGSKPGSSFLGEGGSADRRHHAMRCSPGCQLSHDPGSGPPSRTISRVFQSKSRAPIFSKSLSIRCRSRCRESNRSFRRITLGESAESTLGGITFTMTPRSASAKRHLCSSPKMRMSSRVQKSSWLTPIEATPERI